ncbi:hypothetical protein LUZ60_005853 [Juncus effusus]|nr:hypothetical protein LUZ60_005853 [Juncus effusus]
MENMNMFTPNFSNKSISDETSLSSVTLAPLYTPLSPIQTSLLPVKTKRKRNQPGNPDPEAVVVALSPKTLVTTNRYICEICNKGFQRDQNLQLHRRGHNVPWTLRLRNSSKDGGVKKRVYVCPEPTCVHHDPSRALGDLTGIKKHYSRKHGEKKWRCERCGKRYAVQSDWKVHVKNCGTKEYRCDCGILFSRKDSLVTHRAFCDALAEESARVLLANTITTINPLPLHPSFNQNPKTNHIGVINPNPNPNSNYTAMINQHSNHTAMINPNPNHIAMINPNPNHITAINPNLNPNASLMSFQLNPQHQTLHKPLFQPCLTLPTTIPTNTLVEKPFLQKGCNVGPTNYNNRKLHPFTTLGDMIKDESNGSNLATWHADQRLTRDFLGVVEEEEEEEETSGVEELAPLPLIFG